jgi:GNAT superfamily N-acetyltransferase
MNIRLRKMTAADVPLGMKLKQQAGWNQTESDWRRFLELEPEGCFVAEWEGLPVATTTTCVFDSIGWIAMVLVDQSFRHRGIATRLLQHALEYLDRRGVATARLDATPLGRPVYERLGFVAEHELLRLEGVATAREPEAGVAISRAVRVGSLAELDREATGADRRRLLERLLAEQPDGTRVALQGAAVLGYAMLRPGSRATQIGPGVAVTAQAGRALGDWAMSQLAGRPVFADVPLQNQPAVDWARQCGLSEQRPFTRMYRGRPVAEQPRLLWASSGPEKG